MLRRSSGAFRSFRVSRKYSGMRSGGGGTHRKDTGNIGNNRGTWEITGVPLTFSTLAMSTLCTDGRKCMDEFWDFGLMYSQFSEIDNYTFLLLSHRTII